MKLLQWIHNIFLEKYIDEMCLLCDITRYFVSFYLIANLETERQLSNQLRINLIGYMYLLLTMLGLMRAKSFVITEWILKAHNKEVFASGEKMNEKWLFNKCRSQFVVLR